MTALLDAIGYSGWALHALVWLPALGAGLVLWAGEAQAKKVAFWWSLAVFVLSLGLWWAFDPTLGGMQMESTTPWIDAWGVDYALGIDGISLFMVMLTTFSTSMAILGSFNYIRTRERAFYALMLLLEAAVIGELTEKKECLWSHGETAAPEAIPEFERDELARLNELQRPA